MTLTTFEKNRNAVNLLWGQNIRNAREISQITGVSLRSCERYVSSLKKMIVKRNHFTTAGEMKEEKNSELEVSERTIRRELKNLGFASVLPRRVPLLTQKSKREPIGVGQ
ncbi:14416_t:CDS:2 [Rhizophagus irregularis]|nr:14416_t:CDS:2 [Rhizophagus irregularis]